MLIIDSVSTYGVVEVSASDLGNREAATIVDLFCVNTDNDWITFFSWQILLTENKLVQPGVMGRFDEWLISGFLDVS